MQTGLILIIFLDFLNILFLIHRMLENHSSRTIVTCLKLHHNQLRIVTCLKLHHNLTIRLTLIGLYNMNCVSGLARYNSILCRSDGMKDLTFFTLSTTIFRIFSACPNDCSFKLPSLFNFLKF